MSRTRWSPLLALIGALLVTAGSAAAQVLSGSLVYTAIQPCRIVDTRHTGASGNVDAPLLPGVSRQFHVVGSANNFHDQGGKTGGCGIPGYVGATPQVQAVMFNFSVVPSGEGYLQAWPSGSAPLSAILTFGAVTKFQVPAAIANGLVVPVAQDGVEGNDLIAMTSFANIELVIDVTGYFSGAGSPSGITAVNAGTGLSGGGTSGGVTLSAAVPFALGAPSPGGTAGAQLVGTGIGSLGATGIQGWGQTGIYAYGFSYGVFAETPFSSGTALYGNAYGGGNGVFGNSIGGAGVRGQSDTGIGVDAEGGGASSTALMVANGALRVGGSARPAFVHIVHPDGSARNTCDEANGNDFTVIDNPISNFNPNALLFVNLVYNGPADQRIVYNSTTRGDCSRPGCCPAGHWMLSRIDIHGWVDQEGVRYNILVISQ